MAEIEIYEPISDELTRRVKSDLGKLPASEPVTLALNSPGGYLHDGLAIFNLVNRHKGPVTTRVDGAAFSAASILMLAADTRQMAENALVMIHDPWLPSVPGEIPELRRALDYLNRTKRQTQTIYADRTGWTKQEAAEAMTQEVWLESGEALSTGFATEIIDAQPVEMCLPKGLPLKHEGRLAEFLAQRVVPLGQREAREVLASARQRATSFLEV